MKWPNFKPIPIYLNKLPESIKTVFLLILLVFNNLIPLNNCYFFHIILSGYLAYLVWLSGIRFRRLIKSIFLLTLFTVLLLVVNVLGNYPNFTRILLFIFQYLNGILIIMIFIKTVDFYSLSCLFNKIGFLSFIFLVFLYLKNFINIFYNKLNNSMKFIGDKKSGNISLLTKLGKETFISSKIRTDMIYQRYVKLKCR